MKKAGIRDPQRLSQNSISPQRRRETQRKTLNSCPLRASASVVSFEMDS